MRKFIFLFILFMYSYSNAQKIIVETLKVKDSLTIMKVELLPEQLGLKKNIKAEKIVLKIFFNKNGSIENEFQNYKAQKKEITFFYALNYQQEKLEMHFIFDKYLKKFYSKDDFNKLIKIIEILEHHVFSAESFSGTIAYGALENAL